MYCVILTLDILAKSMGGKYINEECKNVSIHNISNIFSAVYFADCHCFV